MNTQSILNRIAELEDEYGNPSKALIQGRPDIEIREEYSDLLTALNESK